MGYFPKYYIKTNLYTIGSEYIIKSTGQEYSGYYWSTGNNRFYTGKTPQDSIVLEIIPIPKRQELVNAIANGINYESLYLPYDGIIESTPESPYDENIVIDYVNVTKIVQSTPNQYPVLTKLMPSYNPNLPTQQDYENGEFKRYFAKKINANEYLEINQTTYQLLLKKEPEIEWALFLPFNLPWRLTGDKEQVSKINKNIVELNIKNLKLYSFNEYLGFDFTKYYQ